MKKVVFILVTLCFVFIGSREAKAALLIDTGGGFRSDGIMYGGIGKFILPDTATYYKLTGIEGQFCRNWGMGGTVSVFIYDDGGYLPPDPEDPMWPEGMPSTGNQLYSGTINIPFWSAEEYEQHHDDFYESTIDFVGLHGINLNLPPGAYWVAFFYDTYNGYMTHEPINPLPEYLPNQTRSFPVRIYGSPVPEPATLSLLGLGLLGLVFKRKRT